MIIRLSPIRTDDIEPLTLERQGSTLTINGVPHDITALAALEPDDDGLIEWPDPIVRVQGETVTVRFPVPAGAPNGANFPAPIEDPADGPVAMPDTTPVEGPPPEPEPPAEPETLEAARTRRTAELAAVRWERTQTMDYDGVPDAYADSAIAVVTATVVAAQTMQQPELTLDWKLSAGEWREWGLPDLIAYGQAIHAHIQTCFSRERALLAQIAAAETVEAVNAIAFDGWP